MSVFMNLTTRTKLILSFGLLIAMMVAVVNMAYQEILSMRAIEQQLYNRDFSDAADLAAMRAYGNGMRADVLTMMLFTNKAEQEIWHKNVKERTRNINDALHRVLARPHSDPDFNVKLQEVRQVLTTYEDARDQQQIPLIYAGKLKEARDMATGVQAERFTRFRNLLIELGDIADTNAKTAVELSAQNSGKTVRSLVTVTIGAVLIALAMTLLMARIIADPLKQIAGIAKRVAEGDLTDNIVLANRHDEVGLLNQSFHRMIDALRKLATEIGEGMSVLTASSSEILATTSQVASGASQTATAVSQTTTTVEEVKQTVLVSSQKARQVSEMAQKTEQISRNGQHAVEQMIDGMGRIREQSGSVVDTISKLNEQSLAIGEIIATVNDLTEQSKVLAVNAAIEANKAGEHGKGFVVVAQEIKSLAEQSKQATSQVRLLLGYIQKATGAAVMAIDLSSKAIESGSYQSDEAGKAIRMLAEGVGEAAQAAVQIAASSQQQLVGMDQVVLAMDNIKQASTQNMAGTRQAESAAQNLHELGLKLKHIVERYRV